MQLTNTRHRRVLAAIAVIALLALGATPTGSDSGDENVGTAITSLTLASIIVDGLPADLDAADLGGFAAYASNDPDATRNVLGDGVPFARSLLNLPVVGEVSARSDGEGEQPGQSVSLPSGLGSVTAGTMRADATVESALATIDALTGTLAVGTLGLDASLPDLGARSLVDADGALARNGLVIEGLGLDLTDVLPLELLEQLPLSALIDLVGGLEAVGIDLDLGSAVDAVRTEIEALIGGLDDLDDLRGDLAGAITEVDGLLDDHGTLSATVSSLQSTIAALEDEIAALEDEILTVGALLGSTVDEICAVGGLLVDDLCADLEAARAALAAAQDDLTAALSDLADLEATIATLEALVDGLIDDLVATVEDVLDLAATIDLDELIDLVEGILDGVDGVDLFDIGRLVVGVESVAGPDGSSASATCTVVNTQVLGEATDSCGALGGALEGLQAALTDVLSALPLQTVDAVGGAVQIGGLVPTTSEDDATDGDYHVAYAAVDALQLVIEPLELTAVVDTLLADLGNLLDVDGLLDELLDLVGGLPVDGDGALSFLALPGDATALIEQARGELEALLADLDALDLPTELAAGAVTPGIDVRAAGVSSEVSFAEVVGGVPSVPTLPDPAVPGGPGQPVGELPQTGGELPRTGGGLFAGGLLLLALAGAGLVAARKV